MLHRQSSGSVYYITFVGLRISPLPGCPESKVWVTLIWVLGYSGVEGNERADDLARKGATGSLPQPDLPLNIPLIYWSLWRFQSE